MVHARGLELLSENRQSMLDTGSEASDSNAQPSERE